MNVENGNTCLYLVIDGYTEYELYCRWLQNVDNLKVGDVITVTGRIRRYDNFVEFFEPVLGHGSSSDSSSSSSQSSNPSSSVNNSSSNNDSSSSSDSQAQSTTNCQSAVGVPFGALFIAFVASVLLKKREN
jgi:hypothetical protein